MKFDDFIGWWKNVGCTALFFDDALKGNPQLAGAGGVIFESKGKKIKEYSWGIGKQTNNSVECLALNKGLELVRNIGIKELVVFRDSMLVVREARNLMKKRKNLVTKTHHILKCMVNEYKAINFLHLLRANNQHVNIIANKGVDLDCGVLVCNQKDYKRNWIP